MLLPDVQGALLNIFYVVEGYVKWLWDITFKRSNQRTKQRLALCTECEHNKHGVCELCGCVVKAKVRCTFMEDEEGISIDGCPDRKW